MAIKNEKDINKKVLEEIAELMAIAARTAPKARGNDNLEIAVVTGSDIQIIANKMDEISNLHEIPFFSRDAKNLNNAGAILLIASKIKTQGLKICGMCGYSSCEEKEKHPNSPCSFNTMDLGIAIGSACGIAANHHADNRVMYTIGQAVLSLGLFSPEYKIIVGIPLSSSSKNPFFDRQH